MSVMEEKTKQTSTNVEGSREESMDEEEDQLCSDDPDDDDLPYRDRVKFTPELLSESGRSIYRYRCPGSGVFQCEYTGLVFVMAKKGELKYWTIVWDDELLESAGKMPAGPLFKISCSEETALRQLHLPHCETKEVLHIDGLLFTAHISDDGMSFLESLEITDTHAIVKVPHLAAFGLVREYIPRSYPGSGQVLLFLRTPPRGPRVLDVFLLHGNILQTEVAAQHERSEQIRTSSNCPLEDGRSYSLDCLPEGLIVQPKSARYIKKCGPNYLPTFEVLLTPEIPEKVTLIVKYHEGEEVWKRDVYLSEV